MTSIATHRPARVNDGDNPYLENDGQNRPKDDGRIHKPAWSITPMSIALKAYKDCLSQAMQDDDGTGALVAAVQRELAKRDLFYLLVFVLGRSDAMHFWLYDRCIDVQENPDGFLDLWARGHYKSTIITYAKTIQDIINNPNMTVGIFSHTKGIARAFLQQIKYELETNETLKALFPDVLYQDPQREAPVWSLNRGIVVKRTSNPKECTIEAYGLVDGQPTSKHFNLLVYDDVVTLESVSTPEMMQKTTDAWKLSLNLVADQHVIRMIGTRYHASDTWGEIIRQKSAVPRLYPATDNGKPDGKPVFLAKHILAKKRRDMGPYVFAAQMLQDPKADEAQGFNRDDMRYYLSTPDVSTMNVYILVDPSSGKKGRGHDYTSIWVIGLALDRNYYVLDMIRDRLNLRQRGMKVMSLAREYIDRLHCVGYERYGMMADVDYIEELQDREQFRFDIVELGGRLSKEDRIRKLIPVFETHRIYFPRSILYTGHDLVQRNLVKVFIEEELEHFPVATHDDMLDALARIRDPDLPTVWPVKKGEGSGTVKYDRIAEKLRKISRRKRRTSMVL